MAGVFVAPTAWALDVTVDGQVDAQLYVVPRPYLPEPFPVRRYTETLGFVVYDILDAPRKRRKGELPPRLLVSARLRVDSDFGITAAETNPEASQDYIPGLQQTGLDILYAYVEGRDFFGGILDFRIGRQQLIDPSGWWSFDGGWARASSPFYVALELYGGLEERGGLPFSTPRYSADGVFRGNREAMAELLWPSYLNDTSVAPAYGAALKTTTLTWLSAMVGYRKVLNEDTVTTSPFVAQPMSMSLREFSEPRVSSEKTFLGVDLVLEHLGAVDGDLVYDLFIERITTADAGLQWFAGRGLTLGATYSYYYPNFDGDSVFNWFTHQGKTTWLGTATYNASSRTSLALSGGAAVFQAREDGTDSAESSADGIARVSSRTLMGQTLLAAWGLLELGDQGKQGGLNVSATRAFVGQRYDVTAIVSYYSWSAANVPSNSAGSFSYVLLGGFGIARNARLGLQWQQTMNPLVGQQFRVLASARVEVPE